MPRRSTEREESLSTLKGERGRRLVEAVRIFRDVLKPELRGESLKHESDAIGMGFSFLAAFAAWFNRTDQGVIQCSGTKNNSCKLRHVKLRCWACGLCTVMTALWACERLLDFLWTKPSLGCPSRWHEMCSRTRASCSLCDSTGISWYFAVLAVSSAGGAAVLPVASESMEGRTTGWESSDVKRQA